MGVEWWRGTSREMRKYLRGAITTSPPPLLNLPLRSGGWFPPTKRYFRPQNSPHPATLGSLPEADPEGAVVVQPDRSYVLEHAEHFHLPQLSNVQVGNPEPRVLFPGQLSLVHRAVRDPDARVLPVHVQKHVQRYFLKNTSSVALLGVRRHFISWRGGSVTK